MARKTCIVAIVFWVLSLVGCSSSGDSTSFSGGVGDRLQTPPKGTQWPWEGDWGAPPSADGARAFLASRGLTLLRDVTVDGDTGYLAEFTELDAAPGIPKYCLVLTGTPHSMGYQAAYLQPQAAGGMLTRYMKIVGLSQLSTLGFHVDPDSPEGEAVYRILYEVVLDFVRSSEAFIPDRLKEEMTGVADAMRDAGYDEITYDDVLLLNEGVDSTYYLLAAMTGETPNPEANRKARRAILDLLRVMPSMRKSVAIEGEEVLFTNINSNGTAGRTPLFGCNELVLGGRVTRNGETYHGRDFMFATAGIYQHAACVMVYLPDNGIPFVAIDPPGFVGHSVGLNARGVSIGVDINQGAAFGENVGVGCLLIDRHVMDTATDIAGAIEAVKEMEKGTQWIYVLADDEDDPTYGCGVELETGKSAPFTGPDLLPEWEQRMLSGARGHGKDRGLSRGIDYIGMLTDPLPDRGVTVRGADWIFPAQFSEVNISLPVPDPWFNAHGRTSVGIYFPEQIEADPGVLVATNHSIIPRMRFTQFHPLVALIYRRGPLPDSVWRYETLLSYAMSNLGDGVPTEFFGPDPEHPAPGSAGWMIDFLNSGREHDWYYGRGHKTVEGHHTVMNNTTLEMKSLFGHMTDPWVGVDLADFVGWYYGSD